MGIPGTGGAVNAERRVFTAEQERAETMEEVVTGLSRISKGKEGQG